MGKPDSIDSLGVATPCVDPSLGQEAVLVLCLKIFGSFKPAAPSIVLLAFAMEHGLVCRRLACDLCCICLILCHLCSTSKECSSGLHIQPLYLPMCTKMLKRHHCIDHDSQPWHIAAKAA